MAVDLPPVDSTGDGLDDIWVTTTWAGSGPAGGLFLFPGTTDTIPADDVRLDLGAEAMWLDGGGVKLVTDSSALGGVGDLTGDGLADVLLFTVGSGGVSQISALAGTPGLTGEHTFGELESMVLDEDASHASAYFVGDLDGDGMDELQFFFYAGGTQLLCYLSGADWQPDRPVADLCSALSDSTADDATLTASWRNELAGGDVDGDGLGDLFLHARDFDGALYSRLMSGGLPSGDAAQWTTAVVEGVASYGWVPDIDGDGINDPVTTSGAASSSVLSAGGTFEAADLRLVKPWAALAHDIRHVADIDEDGLPDWIMTDLSGNDDQFLIVRGFDIPWDDPSKW